MRKSLVAILAVAIIGALGIYGKSHSKPAPAVSTTSTPAVASSSDQSEPSTTPAASNSTASGYKDGTYTGPTEEISYGPVKIAVVISGGKITDVNFLQMPSDEGHSREVTNMSAPILKQQTISAQSANIDFVSGATDTSLGYQKSLQAALDQAKVS